MIINGQNKVSASGETQEAYSSEQFKESAVTGEGSQTGVNNEGAYLAFVVLGDIADGISRCERERPNYPDYAIPRPEPSPRYAAPFPENPREPKKPERPERPERPGRPEREKPERS